MNFTDNTEPDPRCMTEAEKRQYLYLKQKQTLDTFLEKGAISEAQYRTSLTGLRQKMCVDPAETPDA